MTSSRGWALLCLALKISQRRGNNNPQRKSRHPAPPRLSPLQPPHPPPHRDLLPPLRLREEAAYLKCSTGTPATPMAQPGTTTDTHTRQVRRSASPPRNQFRGAMRLLHNQRQNRQLRQHPQQPQQHSCLGMTSSATLLASTPHPHRNLNLPHPPLLRSIWLGWAISKPLRCLPRPLSSTTELNSRSPCLLPLPRMSILPSSHSRSLNHNSHN